MSKPPTPFGAPEHASADALIDPGAETWSARAADWLRRYGVAECAGVTCAFALAFIVRRVTGNAVATAYGGAWGESIGYASVVIWRDARSAARRARIAGREVGGRDVRHVATGLLTEFGPAAILDTLVVRPFAMGVGMRVLGPQRGLLAGKLAADVVFYLPVILMHERQKRRARERPGP